MQAVLEWLAGLPPLLLYLALAASAAVENFFPPVPADTVVAFGSFLAARGEATALGAFLSTWVGNVGGAMTVYALGRRYGTGWLEKRLERFGGSDRQEQLRRLYDRWGLGAIFLSRFIPGVRAIVPPFAGAFKMKPLPVALAIGVASAIWYGLVTYVAYRVGSDWDTLVERLGSLGKWAAIIAGGFVLLGVAIWHLRRRTTTEG